MITKQTGFFLIFTIFTINAMEVEKKVYHFADLPTEICDHIASYLTFNNESDDEFIARTTTFGTVSDEHTALVESHEKDCQLCETQDGSNHILRTYSVDRSKIISFEKFTQNPKALIFDINNKTIHNNERFATELSQETIGFLTHFALSYNGSYCAQLQKHRQWPFTFKVMLYENHLIVTNAFSHEIQTFLIPDQYDDVISIGFNKQGTKIIVHCQENVFWEEILKPKNIFYHIIALTTPEEHEEKSKKTLEAYLRSIGCCKDLAKKLPVLQFLIKNLL